MRQTVMAAAAAFVIGGAATGAVLSEAQPAPPPATPGAPAAEARPMPPWMHFMHGAGGMHPRRFRPETFRLIYRQADRQLAPADVQKIAEAFLLWNGNHTWKVSDVAPASNGMIGFSLSTGEGSVIAKFAMDPHSGRIERVG